MGGALVICSAYRTFQGHQDRVEAGLPELPHNLDSTFYEDLLFYMNLLAIAGQQVIYIERQVMI